MKRKLLRLFFLATILGSLLATTSGVLAQKPVSTTSAAVQTLVQQIASLEVQRALLDARFTSESPYIQDVDRKLRSVRQRLTQIQPNANQATVSSAAKEAIKAKIVQLEAQRLQESKKYTSDSAVIQTLDLQLKSLKKRLKNL